VWLVPAKRGESLDEVMLAYLDAWNSHDPGWVAEFFDIDGVYDDRGAGVVAQGREAIRDHVARVMAAFSDLDFELVRTAQGADFALGEWSATMTHDGRFNGLAPTHRRVQSAGVDIAVLDGDGRVIHMVSYYDGAAIMRDLGLLPKRGSRVERALLRAASVLPRRS
jgi:steroid delta-isomerase-like uncharacterized protein